MPDKQSKTLLILDFDRTIFDLKTFLEDIEKHFWRQHLKGPRELEELNRTLDFFQHPDKYSLEQLHKLWVAPKYLPRSDYTFKEVKNFLDNLPTEVEAVIVTHGVSEPKQYFK